MTKVRMWFQVGRVSTWACNNLRWRELRGNNIEILPFVRLFWPTPHSDTITLHFGWLIFTVGIHYYIPVRYERQVRA